VLAPEANRYLLRKWLRWARTLEEQGLCTLRTNQGETMDSLTPLPKGSKVGLITIYNGQLSAYMSLQGRVIRREAPGSFSVIEEMMRPESMTNNVTVPNVSTEFLDAIVDAYREVASSKL
jgi:hypothetical protein